MPKRKKTMADDAREEQARLDEALDEAFERVDERAARAELEAAGLDPVIVRARMRALADDLLAPPGAADDDLGALDAPVPLPWVRRRAGRWVCEPAVASEARDERGWIALDFTRKGLGGGVQVGIFLQAQADGGRSLQVEWEAGFHHPGGWRLSMYEADETEPVFSRNLGGANRGSVVLTAEDIGRDPARVPMKFKFEPEG